MSDLVDTIVIGAGHAGLSVSYYLKNLQVEHIVFEKGTIGSSWMNQRWDSFRFNTPNKYNHLPGMENTFADQDGFCTAGEFASYIEEYSKINVLPVAENCEVISVENSPDSKDFFVYVREKDFNVRQFRSRNVIVASGGQNKKYVPSFSDSISKNIFQIHAGEYRNAGSLPEGAVLVIGGAQSGVQITEDLLDSRRKVFLSTSSVPRIPRRYRNKDIVDWLYFSGFFDMRTADMSDPRSLMIRFPQISGTGSRGHTVSLQGLAKKGALLMGKAKGAEHGKIYLQTDILANIRFADEFSLKTKHLIDEFIRNSGYEMPANEADPDDLPDELFCPDDINSLDLFENQISSIIWTCGFVSDFSFLRIPVFDTNGNIRHNEGISTIEGLYFLGLPWLRKRKSGIVMGIKEDAEFIASHLKAAMK